MAQIDQLLDLALERRATDLHLRVGLPPLGRVRGELVTIREDPVSAAEMEPLLMEIVTLEQRTRLLDDLELDFGHPHGKGRAWFRVTYFHERAGLSAVFRRVPTKIPSLSDLRLPEPLRKLATRRNGLVLVTGGARSGKSVTLAAMVQALTQARSCHVVTVEDPIELLHESQRSLVTQREVGLHVRSIEEGLRLGSRDDPDAMVLTDFPSVEATRLAIELASSGVLVLGNLVARSAPAAIERLVSEAPEAERPALRDSLSRCLAGVTCQQLVDLADGKGRIAAVEVLLLTPKAADAVREGRPLELSELVLDPAGAGIQTMDMALEKLVGDRLITPETALDKAADRQAFLKLGGGRPLA